MPPLVMEVEVTIDRLLIGISTVELTYGALALGLGHYTVFQFATLALLIIKATAVAAESLGKPE